MVSVASNSLGGLNSYSLVIMVVAVFKYHKPRMSSHLGKLLVLFFGFYSKFAYDQYAIDINGDR